MALTEPPRTLPAAADAVDDACPAAEQRSPRWVAPLLTGGVLAVGCAAVLVADPGDSGTPVCLSKSLFGIDCPFCGGLRAANSMLRGHWLVAADHNVLLAVALPVLAVLWLVWLVQSMRGRELHLPKVPRAAVWACVAVVVAFTVLRNLPVDSGWIHWLASGAA
ncbi:MAG: DUF2752 domain-containing protein [Actinobacteria bacterium]|nr:DUF2752 domain-containing protein [Actinomycetota bacterium]